MIKANKLIALFGGSFNPATRRHRAIGQRLLEQLPIEQVWYLVSPQNPFKSTQGMARFEDRVAMLRLNVEDEPRFVVQTIEARYAQECGQVAINSSISLRCLVRDFPDHRFLWVVGADNFVQMHTWSGYRDIIAKHPVIVVPREGYDGKIEDCPSAKEMVALHHIDKTQMSLGWFLLKMEPSGINATACRKELRAEKEPLSMRPAVVRYALSRALYRKTRTPI